MGPAYDHLASLPHGDPFRFISDVVEILPQERGRAAWIVRGDEDFFRGHFPDQPLVPGVLLLEAMAQLSGLIGLHTPTQNGTTRAGRLVHADVRFEEPVQPPARVILESAVVRTLGALQQFEVSASVNGVRVARGTLTLAEVPVSRASGGVTA